MFNVGARVRVKQMVDKYPIGIVPVGTTDADEDALIEEWLASEYLEVI